MMAVVRRVKLKMAVGGMAVGRMAMVMLEGWLCIVRINLHGEDGC
jgi:hypothetical protein